MQKKKSKKSWKKNKKPGCSCFICQGNTKEEIIKKKMAFIDLDGNIFDFKVVSRDKTK